MPNTQSTWPLTLSRQQLFLLARGLGGPGPLGLKDPFGNLSPDAAQAALAQTRQSLVDRGYAEAAPDGALAVDPTVLALAGAPGRSGSVLLGTCSGNGGASVQRVVYLTPELIVEQETLPSEEVVLTAVRDSATLRKRAKHFLRILTAPAAPGGEVTVSEASLREAQFAAILEDQATCASLFSEVGVAAPSAQALASTLRQDYHAGSLMLLRMANDEARLAQGLSWIVGASGGWCAELKEQTADSPICLVPTAAAQIRQRLAVVVDSALAARLGASEN